MKSMIWVVLCLIFLVGCSPAVVEPQPQQQSEAVEQLSESLTVETMLLGLKQSFVGMKVEVDREFKCFMLTPIDKVGSAAEIDLIIAGDSEYVLAWIVMANDVKSTSRLIESQLPGLGYGISLVNPTNPDKVLLTVFNGVVLYDFTKDDL